MRPLSWLPASHTPRADAAARYAENGFRVLPLHNILPDGSCSCGKCPPDDPKRGKHPRLLKWQNKATSDSATVASWWMQWPDANVGLLMGDGLVAVDIDGEPGCASLATIRGEREMPPTLSSNTGREDGAHYIYRLQAHQDPARLGSRSGARWPGIDTRGDGGQIVVAPSVHYSGAQYTWAACTPIADMPDWLFDALAVEGTPKASSVKQATGGRPSTATPNKVNRARAYLAKCEPAIQGSNGSTTTLNAAMKLFTKFDLDEATVLDLLRDDYNPRCQPPWTTKELEHKVADAACHAIRNTSESPADYPANWDDIDERESPSSEEDASQQGSCNAAGTAPCSDLANAERLAGEHGPDIRYVGTWEKWKTWDGTRWGDDDTGEMMRRVSDVARKTYAQAKKAFEKRGDDAAKAFLSFAKRSQDAAKLNAAIKVASSLPSIAVHHTAFDQDPWLLNATNGTLDLRTGELRPHRREDLLSKRIGCPYDPHATCPIWDAFLLRVMGGDRELVQYLQRLIGYALTGETRDHILAFFFGGGANGKTTFLQVVREMMGDYAATAPRGLLFAPKGGEKHPAELTVLHGARFVVCAEVAQGQAFDEALVKDLTGGDEISARRMREDFWHFTPTHKLFLAGNHRPVVRGDDDGIWRRVKLIPWTVTIPKEDRDATLRERLRAELPGILRWAVEGCRAWQERGLDEPSAVTKATSGYRAESDFLGQFLAERCRFESGASVPCKDLREAYEEWCKELGALPVGARTIGDRLRKNAVKKGNIRSKFDSTKFVEAWRGVRFATEAERTLVGSVG